MRLSIIIPAHNSESTLPACLDSVFATLPADVEVIVVDDGSSDATSAVAARYPVKFHRRDQCSGPSAARNVGASMATAELLFFLDADIIVPAGTWQHVLSVFDGNPGVSAFFGSYTPDTPASSAPSRFKNLLHHDTHQQALTEATTFCGGFGGIRASAFASVGGFNEEMWAVEDIDLGYRLKANGHRILLIKNLFFTHLKQYTVLSLIKSDLLRRAIPWTQLMLEHRTWRADLNTRPLHALCALLCIAMVLAVQPLHPVAQAPLLMLGALTLLALLNLRFLRFVAQQQGPLLAVQSYLFLLQTYVICLVGACVGATRWWLARGAEFMRSRLRRGAES